MHRLFHELRLAFRQSRKAPGFTSTVVLTLALGIGFTTAVFSLIEGVLLRPLAFANPDRLVLVGDHLGDSPNASVTAREIDAYASTSSAFSSMGGYITTQFELSGQATPEALPAGRLGADVFTTLGVRPALGRVFTREEEAGRQPLAVISYSLWTNRFHRSPEVLGTSIVLDRKPYTVIGVMPRDFEFPLQAGRLNQTQVWVPLSLTADELSDQSAGFWGYRIVARLKDGVTLAQAANDANRVSQQIKQNFPPRMAALKLRGDAIDLRESLVADVRPLLRILLFAVVIVLLIACVNIAGLLLVRAIRRRRECAVRLALGASPAAIVRQSMIEGLVISFAGGLLGLGLGAVLIQLTVKLLPDSMPRIDAISINSRVGGFGLLLASVSGVFCSLAPAFAALRTDLTSSLQEGARTSAGAHSHSWLRSVLVVSQVAVALVLLVLSGSFLRSYQKMRAVDPGFSPDHVLVASYQLPLEQYATHSASQSFNKRVLDRLSATPGVNAVGLASAIPATGGSGMSTFTVEGEPVENWKTTFASFSITEGDYFRAMGIPLLAGRTFTNDDRADTPLVIIVNQSMAKHSWPGRSPLGQRMHVGNPKKGYPLATVVGVVADTKLGARDEPTLDQWYAPASQPATLFGTDATDALTQPANEFVLLRSTLPAEQMTFTLQAAVAEIDPLLALQQIQPMHQAMEDIEAPRRFNTEIIAGFAFVSLLLGITGIYAVVAFTASLRTQEIAVRMALGAQRGGIMRLVVGSGLRLALVGCGIGVVASLAASRLVSSMLFEVSPTDPFIYLGCVLLMMTMAGLGSTIPAIRAASADPIDALRTT